MASIESWQSIHRVLANHAHNVTTVRSNIWEHSFYSWVTAYSQKALSDMMASGLPLVEGQDVYILYDGCVKKLSGCIWSKGVLRQLGQQSESLNTAPSSKESAMSSTKA